MVQNVYILVSSKKKQEQKEWIIPNSFYEISINLMQNPKYFLERKNVAQISWTQM